ncbi:MAG: ribonuclease HII [Clostridia bacterium]|nr:ribonuclease HII [Clostridia bacterium]MDD4048879.1 ribonuclease HII [Clostridia bacterium]
MNNYKKNSINEIKKLINDTSDEMIPQLIHKLQVDERKGVKKLVLKRENEIIKKKNELNRLKILGEKECKLKKMGYKYVGGIDEAGRGPLAGPVVAACVILPDDCILPGLNDSKKLSSKVREQLEEKIKKEAIAWAVGLVNHKEIDRLNIYQATRLAMLKAVKRMLVKPDYLIIDAMKIDVDLPQEGIIHGDSLCASIAAASVIAKTYRDRIMNIMDKFYPKYGFKENKGYGTNQHILALKAYGHAPIHRKTFLKGNDSSTTVKR